MSLLDGNLEVKLSPPLSRASRKGLKFFRLGKPVTDCPYSNARRKQQFEWAWQEMREFAEWDQALNDGIN